MGKSPGRDTVGSWGRSGGGEKCIWSVRDTAFHVASWGHLGLKGPAVADPRKQCRDIRDSVTGGMNVCLRSCG